MNWRIFLLLALLGSGISLAIAQFQSIPGYMDSDYYFEGGVQLAQGKGFTEPYLWNYLDDPRGLPHPSHTYWMPLSSMLAATGMWLTGKATYQSSRLAFILLAALIPCVTLSFAYNFSNRRDLALISGLLAVFTGFYAPFLPVTDNYGPYLILGGLYFLTLGTRNYYSYFFLGGIAGLLALARSDGLMWFVLTLITIFWRHRFDKSMKVKILNVLSVVCGFVIIMGPWFWRTFSIYGTFLAPGGSHLLWLKSYDETFIFPAAQLNLQSWLLTGWGNILAARLIALKWNLLNAFAAQGEIFIFPFILIGIWKCRSDERVRLGILAWLGLLFVMTVIFPFAGWRGGFFHSGAVLQILWWTLAPIGLDFLISGLRKRNLFTPEAFKVFEGALVGMAVFMTAFVIYIKFLPGWGMDGEAGYPKIELYLQNNGIQAGDIVMVRNPPGYFMMTGQPAIVVPYGNETDLFQAALRYHAKYVILEAAGAAGPIKTLYDNQQSQYFSFMSEINGTRIYKVKQ